MIVYDDEGCMRGMVTGRDICGKNRMPVQVMRRSLQKSRRDLNLLRLVIISVEWQRLLL